ncbi:MAG: ATP-binding cassette domain-containing protein [Clostridiales bacterium]|nr:ATP-binding cassette domain-containing protein [Clostridiales bacterium]
MSENKKALVRVEDLKVHFPVKGGMPFAKKKYVKAVNGVSLEIEAGETFGLVGESGCGKSTLGNAILGMQKPTDGKIFFKDQDIHALPAKEFKELRRGMQMIFQDPFSSLNPRFDVYHIIAEPMQIRGGMTEEEIKNRISELLHLVGLSDDDMPRFPSDFSGGQRQRIGIARAIALNPEFLVCDEPVSALDVSVHAQILNLLMDLQKELGITYLFISHNLAVVKDICSKVAVMYLGSMMETGDTQLIFQKPMHPYTRSLLSAVLSVDIDNAPQRIILKGDIPSPINTPAGCPFCTRCPYAKEQCMKEKPELREMESGHFVACHFPLVEEQ